MHILFVCTGNTCRSPMAEALMEKIGKENGFSHLTVDSAGIFANPASPMSRGAKEALEKAFTITDFDHRAKIVTKELLDKADLIIAATEDHRRLLVQKFGFEDKTTTFPEDISDPYGGFAQAYETAANAIYSGLMTLLGEGVIYD